MLTIIEDTRQKKDKHEAKHGWWEAHKTKVIRCALPFGDYCPPPPVAIDTKQDIAEIGFNMCGSVREKRRFKNECQEARDAGTRLVFLVEDKRFDVVEDLYGKQIQLHNGQIVPGDQLATAMRTMENRYGCEFMFCAPEEAAQIITELLEEWAKGTF